MVNLNRKIRKKICFAKFTSCVVVFLMIFNVVLPVTHAVAQTTTSLEQPVKILPLNDGYIALRGDGSLFVKAGDEESSIKIEEAHGKRNVTIKNEKNGKVDKLIFDIKAGTVYSTYTGKTVNIGRFDHSLKGGFFARKNSKQKLTESAANSAAVATNSTAVAVKTAAAVNPATATNSTAVATNSAATATNSTAVATNSAATAVNPAVATNSTAVATNSAATATNSTAVATNSAATAGNSDENSPVEILRISWKQIADSLGWIARRAGLVGLLAGYTGIGGAALATFNAIGLIVKKVGAFIPGETSHGIAVYYKTVTPCHGIRKGLCVTANKAISLGLY